VGHGDAQGAGGGFGGLEDLAVGDGDLGEAPLYTAPPRALPGPLGGRLGVVLLALVAMALSALVVHLLRASLSGGEAAPRPSLASASPPADAPTSRRVARRGDARVLTSRADARAPSGVARYASPHLGGVSPLQPRGAKLRRTSAETRETSNLRACAWGRAWVGSSEVGAAAPVSASSEAVDMAPASEASAANPEFGFER